MSTLKGFTVSRVAVEQSFSNDSLEQVLLVSGSTIHKASVEGQFPPKFDTVFSSVIYVPPTTGSLIFAKKAITATNML